MQNKGEHADTHSLPTQSTTIPTTTGSSYRGRQRKLLLAMQELISQQEFYCQKDTHYITNQSIDTPTWEEFKHNQHLELQEHMCHPIAFHEEMMGDIMQMHQNISQPDDAEFIKVMAKEINAHVEKKYWVWSSIAKYLPMLMSSQQYGPCAENATLPPM